MLVQVKLENQEGARSMGLIISLVVVAVVLLTVITFGKTIRKREHIQQREKRLKLKHDKMSFLKRQAALELDFIGSTKPFARELALQLEEAFPISYQVEVYNRMVEETDFDEQTLMELLFEQKRFMLMTSVLKNVPMFSKRVDEVWHTMLMFTKSYQSFTESFAGQFIHHQPNVDGIDGADDRFLFDMMYLELFEEMPFSKKAWGFSFYRNKPSQRFIHEWETESVDTLRTYYFFDRPEVEGIARILIGSVKSAIEARKDYRKITEFQDIRENIRNRNSRTPETDYLNTFTLAYVFWVAWDSPANYDNSLGFEKYDSSSAKTTGAFFGIGGDSNDGSGGSSCGSSCGGSGCGSA